MHGKGRHKPRHVRVGVGGIQLSIVVRGVRQQERVGGYCVSMKQSLYNSATESRGLKHVATFLIS